MLNVAIVWFGSGLLGLIIIYLTEMKVEDKIIIEFRDAFFATIFGLVTFCASLLCLTAFLKNLFTKKSLKDFESSERQESGLLGGIELDVKPIMDSLDINYSLSSKQEAKNRKSENARKAANARWAKHRARKQ